LIPFLQIKWEKFTESQTPPSFEIQDILWCFRETDLEIHQLTQENREESSSQRLEGAPYNRLSGWGQKTLPWEVFGQFGGSVCFPFHIKAGDTESSNPNN
jgi:hypothetical protein